MRKGVAPTLATTIAAAVLIAGAGSLAIAQRMETEATQGPSQGQPAATENPAEGQPGTMQGSTQGRSAVEEKNEQRAGQPGAMEKTPSQGRPAAEQKKEQRFAQPGAMQGGTRKGQAQGRSAMERNGGGVTEQRSAASATLSSDHRSRVHEIITGTNIHRVDHVNFSLAVGTRIPRSVRAYTVPESIVKIVPQYRGFKYIVVGDQLVIIDPSTLEIVAIVSA